MAIDDPVDITIRQAKADSEASSWLPAQLVRLGISGAAAATLAKMPFVLKFSLALSALAQLALKSGS
jgi:hypothetical protein